MNRYRKHTFSPPNIDELLTYLPNSHDNLGQISLKLIYLIIFVLLIFSLIFFPINLTKNYKQEKIIKQSQNVWHLYSQAAQKCNSTALEDAYNILFAENNDFKGWITIEDTKIDYPIFQTNSNSFYINHNQNKIASHYGALHFDKNCKITQNKTDKNLIVYGNNVKNGAMFGELENFRNIYFYKKHSIINFSTEYCSSKYKIFAIFILNSAKKDDDGHIYNIYRQNFLDDKDFNQWINEAYERSVINTGVEVSKDDKILTLVTSANDFDNARLVIMASEINPDNNYLNKTTEPKLNTNPRYPKIWYTTRSVS